MLYIIIIQHNQPIECFLYDHENETLEFRLSDISDWIFSRQKFYRRGEICMGWVHMFINLVFFFLVLTCGLLLYHNKAHEVYVIWCSIYLYLFCDLVLTFSLLYFKMNKYHNFEFKRTKRSMQMQFVFMLLAVLGHVIFLVYFFFLSRWVTS